MILGIYFIYSFMNSNIKPENFVRLENIYVVMSDVNSRLAEVSCDDFNGRFIENMWTTLFKEVNMKDCVAFSYIPDYESDPFSTNFLWSFNYFFYSESQKKIVMLSCIAKKYIFLYFYILF